MHLQTHILSGWCVANFLPLTPRDRLLCMIAATAPDLDGLGVVFGIDSDAYQNYHHLLGHNLPFGILLAGILTIFASRRLPALLISLALFHLHLLMDYFGSGPGWPIHYLWPLADRPIVNWSAWEFFSWQNISAAYGLLAVTLAIAVLRGRTPLECLMPSLDRRLVGWLHAATGRAIPPA